MSAAQEIVAACPSEQEWQRLLGLEAVHQKLLRNHERMQGVLDAAVLVADRAELLVAWNHYRVVVADLNRVTADLGSLRQNLA